MKYLKSRFKTCLIFIQPTGIILKSRGSLNMIIFINSLNLVKLYTLFPLGFYNVSIIPDR